MPFDHNLDGVIVPFLTFKVSGVQSLGVLRRPPGNVINRMGK